MNSVLIAIVQVFVAQGPWCTQRLAVKEKDPILELDLRYVAESDLRRRDLSLNRKEFYESWLNQFEDAIRKHPNSPRKKHAKGRIIELLNGLGRYSESVELLKIDLDEAKSEWELRHATYQIAEVARNAYVVDNNPSFARTAIDSFRAVCDSTQSPNAQMVVSLSRIGELEEAAFAHNSEAGDAYLMACQALVQLDEMERKHLGDLERRQESYLRSAAFAYAKAGRVEDAISTMESLERVENRQFPMTHHLIGLVDAVEGDSPPLELIRYAERRSKELRCENLASELTVRVARAYSRANEFDAAIRSWESYLEFAEKPEFRTSKWSQIGLAQAYLQGLYYKIGEPERSKQLENRIAAWQRGAD